ncbi:MAG: N-acetyltransferase [Bacteroidetes bacterium]|nr:MAG: N-acetyltransferase [Bacteroidota bacterium]
MAEPIILELKTCTLREWREGDEESLVQNANNKKIWDNVRDLFPYPYTRENAEWWIKEGCKKEGAFSLAIEVHGNAVGGIGFVFKEDIYRRTMEIGYWLGEEHWGKGIMTDAVQGITEYGFANFDVCRIYAGVFDTNIGSIRVLEKAGYQLEARLRKNITKNEQPVDELIYVMVR